MAFGNKRRKLHHGGKQIDELTFDPTARQEYLTGFHKRKEQRKKHAQEVAARLEKEEKVRERKQLRDQRKIDLQEHVQEFNKELRKQNPDLSSVDSEYEEGGGEDEEWSGIVEDLESKAKEVEREDEYVDEDKYTTVTVEAMGGPEDEDQDQRPLHAAADDTQGVTTNSETKKRPWSKQRPNDGKAKVKKKKFRYESKLERQATRKKQQSSSRAAKARRKAQD